MNRTISSEQPITGVVAKDEVLSDSPPCVSVLHIYAGNLYGGIETLLVTLARTGHLEPSMRMEFALCFPGRLRDELEAAGAHVHDLGPVKFRHPWTIVRARRRLAKLIKRNQFDVIVTHACWPHALFASTVRRGGRSLVFWQHDFVGSRHWIERLAARSQPDLVISNSKASAETLPQLFPGVPAEVVYCPVSAPSPSSDPVRERLRIRQELATPEDSVVIIQACRMERWKGHALLLEALSHLPDRADWVAWIAGGAQRPHERAYLEELKSQAEILGVADRIRFLGQREDVPKLLASADIHCQPNLSPEPFGIAFIEALYAGLPIVTTRMGGAVEIVNPDCGILVEPGDVLGLVDALRQLLANPAKRARLSQAGLGQTVDMCNPEYTLRRLSDLLFDALAYSS